jgi:hypothetical protein
MNETSRDNSEIERLLRRAKLPEPSAKLKERVTSAARKAWDQAVPDVPWQIAIRRLAMSAAAAVLMVSVADYCADRVLAGRQPHGLAAAIEEPRDLGDWPEMPYSPLVRHLAMTNKSSARNLATLLEYVAKIRQILDESDPGEAPDAGAPVEYKSRLLPTRLSFCS